MGQYQVDLILDVLFLGFDRQKRKEKGSSFGCLGQVGSHAGSMKIEDKDDEASGTFQTQWKARSLCLCNRRAGWSDKGQGQHKTTWCTTDFKTAEIPVRSLQKQNVLGCFSDLGFSNAEILNLRVITLPNFYIRYPVYWIFTLYFIIVVIWSSNEIIYTRKSPKHEELYWRVAAFRKVEIHCPRALVFKGCFTDKSIAITWSLLERQTSKNYSRLPDSLSEC